MKPLYQADLAQRLRIRRAWWMGLYRYTRWRWHVVFAVLDALGWTLFGMVRLLQAWRRRHDKPRRDPRSILVVQLDHLGDTVMSLGMLRCLRERFPAARLEVLCSSANHELFASVPGLHVVHRLAVTRFSRPRGWLWIAELLRVGLRLRRRNYDLAIDARGEFPIALLLWLAGARRRLGWSSGGGGFLLTDRLRHVPGRHEVLSRAALLSALGIVRSSDDVSPRYESLPGALQEIDDRLNREACVPLILLHVGAGIPAKRWPAERWSELAARLILEFDARIVFVGSESDRAQAATVLASAAAAGLAHVKDWTGHLSLVQFAALLRRADLFVGADSGPAHLAAAAGAPVVALFSGTNDPSQWRPWGENVAVVRHPPACSPCHKEACPWADHPCMQALSCDAVLAPIRGFLHRRFHSHSIPAISIPAVRSMEGEPDGPASDAALAARGTREIHVAA